MQKYRAIKTGVLVYCSVLVVVFIGLYSKDVFATFGNPHCEGCRCSDTTITTQQIKDTDHPDGEKEITEAWTADFVNHRTWIATDYLKDLFVPALMKLTEQMSNVAMEQMMIVGKFFDAKIQLETQRVFNELQNEANKNYYPSESFCWFGTNVRSLADSESLSKATHAGFNQLTMSRHLGTMHGNAANNKDVPEKRGRWQQFIRTYCNPSDNGFDPSAPGGKTGLAYALLPGGGSADICNAGAVDQDRINRHVDYQRLIESTRTFNELGIADGAGLLEDGEDIVALGRNLYGHKPLTRSFSDKKEDDIISLRSIAAKRLVAENTYHTLVSLRTPGSSGVSGIDSAQFLNSIIRDLGITNIQDIQELYGERPSFLAQLEVISKKIFQNPDFFTDLHEQPANIKRKMAAMNAIRLMLDRAIYESELRHEMLTSVLLSARLERDKDKAARAYSLVDKTEAE